MLLVIDVGNTNSKFAVFDGDRELAQWRLQTVHARTADEYAIALTQLMDLRGMKLSDITGAVIATVVPQALFNLRRLCSEYFKVAPLVVGEPGTDLGIKVLIDRPQEAGADRLVCAVAAHKQFGGPLIVIDFGSGTTFDVVDAEGNFCGGVISPGIQLSIEAFYLMTARLPRIRVEKPEHVIGKATVPAMQSGVFWGYIGLIEKLVGLIKEEFGQKMKVVATGGLAPLFLEHTDVIEAVEPNLTLLGLVEIWRRNRPNA
jgi:type III pantothenate kinase